MPPRIPNPNDLLKILPAFFMMGLLPVCVIDLDAFIQQIFVEKLMFCICWYQLLVLTSRVIFFLRSQFQSVLSFLPSQEVNFWLFLKELKKNYQELLSIHLGSFFLDRELDMSA